MRNEASPLLGAFVMGVVLAGFGCGVGQPETNTTDAAGSGGATTAGAGGGTSGVGGMGASTSSATSGVGASGTTTATSSATSSVGAGGMGAGSSTTSSVGAGGMGSGSSTTSSVGAGGMGAGSSTTSSVGAGGGPSTCATPASCPPPANACATATCTGGQCGLAFVASGVPTLDQTAGDCHTTTCDGAGNLVSVVDNADVPSDGSACTDDVCTNGVPSNPNKAAGVSCGPSLLCDGAGKCVGCVAASGCPGTDTECRTRTCAAGMCGFSYQPATVMTAAQSAGDCHQNRCDGAGNIHSVVDNSDVPVDGKACTNDTCTAGVPSNPNLAAGAVCSGTSHCDGAGNCVACAGGQTYCGSACVNTQTDANNCGSCNHVCAAGSPCVSGTCGSCMPNNTVYNGHITNYTLGGATVACHYPTNTLPQYYGAMNEFDYAAAAVCGACAEVTNTQNNAKVTVLIADECPFIGNQQWCFNGSHHIDMNVAAYNAVGANNNPAVTWRYVPCPAAAAANIKYYFDPNAQVNYLAVTIMNHRYAITKVEVMINGAFQALTRQTYNVWTLPSMGGAGAGPYTFRVTDIYNHVLTDASVALSPGQVVSGGGQFPICN